MMLEVSSRGRDRHVHHEGSRAPDRPADGLEVPAWMLTVVIVGSGLAIGTVHVPVLAVVAALAFASTALVLFRSAEARASRVFPLPAVICAVLLAYTLLQAVPLPIGWLRVVAPAAADVWDRSLLPFGEAGPGWASLSLDPGATLVEALKWATYAAVFLVSAAVSAKRGATWLVVVVFSAAVALSLVTLAHGLAGATSVYGFYKPSFQAATWHVGPLLNGNNLAGYLNLGVLAGLSLLLTHHRTKLPKWLIALGVATIVGIEIISASRAGILVLPLGVAALAIMARMLEQRASSWMMILAIAGGGLLAALGGTYGVWAELYNKDISKLEMVFWAKPLVNDHAWFGIGRGAFESVFPAYRRGTGNLVFTHAENFPAQWISEWGVPVGVAALAAFAAAFSPRRLGVHKSLLAAGSWIGVVVVLVQNMFDLALEVPAVCIGLATVLGSLWGAARRHRAPGGRVLTGWGARASGVIAGAVGLALVVIALLGGLHDIAADRSAVSAAVTTPGRLMVEQAETIRSELKVAMKRHPAEPYFPLVGAVVAHHLGDENPMPWLQRTLERAGVNGRAHLLLAEVLAARGARKQALLELRLSLHDERGLLGQAAALAARWARDFDEILLAVPDGGDGGEVLAAVAGWIVDDALRARCDREAIHRDAKLIGPRVREADARIRALAQGGTSRICPDRLRCHAEIIEHVDAIGAVDVSRSTALQLRARLMVVEDRVEDAVRLLAESCERFSDRTACLLVRAQVAAALKEPASLDAAIKDLLGSACSAPVACADAATTAAEIRASRREMGAALALLGRAAREDPLREGRWLRLAEGASRAGSHAEAADALEKVARLRGGADPELRRRINEERLHALDRLVPR